MQYKGLAILFAVVIFVLPFSAGGLGLDVSERKAERISAIALALLLFLASLMPQARIAPALALLATLAFGGVATLAYAALEPAVRPRKIALALALVPPAAGSVLIVTLTSSRNLVFWLAIGAAAAALGWGAGRLIKLAMGARRRRAAP